ncbi:MAG: hypothetical protein GC206_03880, partial [Alphaproteobacteria bacterium]|nr:hypothetical protein [Alphaproteobacteria bacterium]
AAAPAPSVVLQTDKAAAAAATPAATPATPSAAAAAPSATPGDAQTSSAPIATPTDVARVAAAAPATTAPPVAAPAQQPLRAGREEAAPRVERSAKANSASAKATALDVNAAPNVRPAHNEARSAPAPSPVPAASAEAATSSSASAPAHSAAAAVHDAQRALETAGASGGARASTPAGQVAQQIVRRIEGGATKFEMQLDPPELGRVEVKLEMSRDHRVSALIAAEDPATLSQIARAAREIETMLEAAGLQLSDSGLTFDLADRQSADRGETAAPGVTNSEAAPEQTEQALPARALVLERWRGARVDLVA